MTAHTEHIAPVRRNGSLAGTGVGNALEWFDWSIYATFAPFFAASFFSATDRLSAFLASLVVFAVGFLARPVGGLIFGRLADAIGRKRTLAITVTLIALSSGLIGISPTYERIGVFASVILVVARLGQGLAYGGEQPAAGSYLSEQAPPERRGLWSSMIYGSGTIGAMAGLALGAVLTATLGRAAVEAWAWRIPFLIAALGGFFALYMRTRMHESAAFTAEAKGEAEGRPGLGRQMWQMRRSALIVCGLSVGLTVVYYYWVVAASGFSISVLQADPTKVLIAGLLANTVFVAVLPLWGALSDRIGRRPVILIGVIVSILLLFPLSRLINGDPVQLGVAMTIANIFIAAPCAIAPAVMAEMFPTHMRTAGVAVPLAVTVALFGGTSLYLQTWLSTRFGPSAFLGYVVVLLLITAATAVAMPETRGRILHSVRASEEVRAEDTRVAA
ncbi:MFS transporter [Janibacter sp. GXQ6167]|uniref:MFS transporter n=1 Tax=Janibacter sp. GXQ6167 TaxID=3240791 RepID=UPI0035265F6E